MTTCAICQKEFSLDKSLHGHLKAHNLKVAEYYQEYFPRYDLTTGDLIHFKNKQQYFSSKFNSLVNMKKWLNANANRGARDLLAEELIQLIEEKESPYFPSDLYLKLSGLPDKDYYIQHYQSIYDFCHEKDLRNFLHSKLPDSFWKPTHQDFTILIDTREKQPLPFNPSCRQKLDFGDYTSRENYSKTFIERKSGPDFVSTMSQGFDRLCREMQRCKSFESYMFILVESTPDSLYHSLSHKPQSMPYIWHQAKELMLAFPENLQICFSGNRKGSQLLIPKILHYGQQLWNVDLDYYLSRKMKKNVVG